MTHDSWAVGAAYEDYVGRWSRRVAAAFVPWLGVPAGRRWLDVGCGTGALTATVLTEAEPAHVIGVDTSAGFVADARARVTRTLATDRASSTDHAGLTEYPGRSDRRKPTDRARSTFLLGDARALPLADRRFDAVVSGLALNFVPDPHRAVAELVRVAVPGAVVAAYVWDYAEGMAMMRHFWDEAAALDPAAAELDEGTRFPLCRPEPLIGLWSDAGLGGVAVEAIEVPTVFAGFDDYWRPFLGGQGPAPGYAMSLTEERRAALRDRLRARLPAGADGTIALTARVWAVRGMHPRRPTDE